MLCQPTQQENDHSTLTQKTSLDLRDALAGQLSSTNTEPAHSPDDVARISCGRVTQYQQSASLQAAAFHDTEQKQKLRRQLVQNKL